MSQEVERSYVAEAASLLPLASVNSSLLRLSCEAATSLGRGLASEVIIRVVGEIRINRGLSKFLGLSIGPIIGIGKLTYVK